MMNSGKSIPKSIIDPLALLLYGLRKFSLFISVSLCLLLVSLSSFAQYSKLLDFGSNGSYPDGSLISDGTFLYGMTSGGGNYDLGTIFRIKPDGTGYSKILDFDGTSNGSYPYGSLIFDGTFLYGVTDSGGLNDFGTIFKIKPDGTGYINLLDFDGATNGSYPDGSLISDGTFLYGMTSSGGAFDSGTIFKIQPDGSNFSTLLSFNAATDGGYPYGSLILEGSFLYGMTNSGGVNGYGTLFNIMPDGTGYRNLLDFDGATNGSYPTGDLISDGTFLYGMTSYGGANDDGVVFKIKLDGTNFIMLHQLQGSADGSNPYGSLISDGTALYGMTSYYGANDYGTIFKINPDGTQFVNLFDFDGAATGSTPRGSFLLDGGMLYGMTDDGGTKDIGTLFKILPSGSGYSKLIDFNTTGFSPNGSPVSDGTFLYGMTSGGGANNLGTIFKVMPDGSRYVTLLDFEGTINGSSPNGSFFYDGTFLYGMTEKGGASNVGTIFKILPTGNGYTKLFDFNSNDGEYPYGTLISDGTFLYGMTSGGGSDSGVIFKILPDGTGFVKLSDFSVPAGGAQPFGNLLYDGTFMYGMTSQGGASNMGTIFKLQTDGTGYTDLLDFDRQNGSHPSGSLITDGTFLYGMTNAGGDNDIGTIFKIKPDGTGFATLLSFSAFENLSPDVLSDLTFDGTYLYGLTSRGGDNYFSGSLFRIKPDGTGFVNLVEFADTPDGSIPRGSLLLLGTSLYGMTQEGGRDSEGTVFSYTIEPTTTSITIIQQPSDLAACIGSIATFSTDAIGTTNITYQWQFRNVDFTFSDIANGGGYSGANTSTLAINTTGNFGGGVYRCRINGDQAPQVITDNKALLLLPAVTTPTSSDVTNCGPGSVTLTASGGADGQYRWYTVATGGTSIAGEVNSTYITVVLSSTTTYYVAINNGFCESPRTAVVATIVSTTPPSATSASICSGVTATLSASGGTNGQYNWYTVATGGTAIAGEVNSSYTTPVLSSTTVYYVSVTSGICESTRTPVTATIITNGCAPVIAAELLVTVVEGKIVIDLVPLITTVAALDVNSIIVTVQPTLSGAVATIVNGVLTIDYQGISFSGRESITIEACTTTGVCAQQVFDIDVAGNVVVYNALSPGSDGKNDIFYLEYINILEATKTNEVKIFNRWGDVVWEGTNYDNDAVVFTGLNSNGNELPSGIYFYKITFGGGAKALEGFISLKN